MSDVLTAEVIRRSRVTPPQWIVRTIAGDWIFAEDLSARYLAAQVLGDWCEDNGAGDWRPVVQLRENGTLRDILAILSRYAGRVGMSKVSTVAHATVVLASKCVWMGRNDRRTRPEGTIVAGRVWVPGEREDPDDVIGRVKDASIDHPSRWLRACLSRRHCRRLVDRGVCGIAVPTDVIDQVAFVRESFAVMLGRYQVG